MKKISFLFYSCLLTFYAGQAVSQVSISGTGSAPDNSSMLDVQSTSSGILIPRMTTSQRNQISSPAEGLLVYDQDIKAFMFYDGSFWTKLMAAGTGGSSTTAALSCMDILNNQPETPSGLYWIDPDGSLGIEPFVCFCDMETAGGGWTLVGNYNHGSGTTPALNVRSTNLPLLGSTSLGVNEAGTQFWGHASNYLLSKFTFSEIRFFGITSAHSRVLHFKTNHSGTINYFRTGSGNCSGIQSTFIPLVNHNTYLPAAANGFDSSQGDHAMLYQPFYSSGNYNWAVGYSSSTLWEMDSSLGGPGAFTYHQVWIR
jgi:hypothetical protein